MKSHPQHPVAGQPAVVRQMSLTEQLLVDVQIFVIEMGITESLLGTRSVGDSQIIARLRAGRSIQLRNADRLYEFMKVERLRRVDAGARRATACDLSVAEAEDREAALEGWAPGVPRWLGRWLSWFAS